MRQTPTDQVEAARVEGCNGWQLFRYIYLPNIMVHRKPDVRDDRHRLLPTSFDYVKLMTNGGPAHASEVLGTYAYTFAFSSMQVGKAAAVGVFISIFGLIAAFVYTRTEPERRDEIGGDEKIWQLHQRKKDSGVNFVIHLVLIILAVVCLAPIALVLINSFKTDTEIVRNPLTLPVVLHLENYIRAWRNGNYAVGFLNSFKLSGCTVVIILIASTLAGYVLSGKRVKGSGGILLYFMMAMTVPIQLFLFPLYFRLCAQLNLIGNIPATRFHPRGPLHAALGLPDGGPIS